MAGYLGNAPTAVPLTSADITDSTITNADIANSTINLTQKVTGALPVANGGTGLTALGSSLQVLRTNTGATALEFATISTGASAGQVIQVVQGTRSTQTSTTSTTFVTTNLQVSITPSATANKVLVIAQGNAELSGSVTFFEIFRDSTAVSGLANGLTGTQYLNYAGAVAVNYLDSPSTTSAITYSLRFRQSTSGTAYFPAQVCLATIIALEIKG